MIILRGLGHKTPFSGRDSRNAAEDPQPNMHQLNTEGLTANKISVIEQLAYMNKHICFHHRPTGDPLHNCRQASDSQLFTSWVSPEQESQPCHVCPWAVGMVTGRSVSRIIRLVVRRRRRIKDHQRLQISTLAIHTNDHHDVPTPQSVRWRLQLPTCQLGLQQNIWRQYPGLPGNIQQPWTIVHPTTLDNTKETPSFSSHRWNVDTNPDLAFASFGQDSRLPDRRVLGKFPWSQHRPSLITPPNSRFLPTAIRRSVGTFARLIGSAFAFSQINPLRDCHLRTQTLRGYQDFCESLLLFAAKQCIPRGRRKNYVPCWDKECDTLYRSFTRAPVGTESDRAASSLLSRLGQKQQERWVGSCKFHRPLAL